MATIQNAQNEILRKFYDFPKFNEKGERSSSNKKVTDKKGGQFYKSMSVAKTRTQLGNIKVTRSQQGLQNNININVNNLIINNDTMSLYPNNYGLYLANSSFFTKLGSDIINSKPNNKIGTNMNNTKGKALITKRNISQPKINIKSQQTHGNNIKVTKVTVNNIYSNNIESDSNSNDRNIPENCNEAPGVIENLIEGKEKADSFNDDLETAAYKSSSLILKNSVINNMINSIIDQNKNNINFTPTRSHLKKSISNNSLDYGLIKNKKKPIDENKSSGCKDSAEMPVTRYMDVSRNEHEVNLQNCEGFIIVNDEILKAHSVIWEVMIDLENSNESKHHLSTTSNKLLILLEDQIINLNFEIFGITILNKVYVKILKIAYIMLIFLKHISIDYNYENNMKINVKKLIGSVNEHLLYLIENYVFNKENNHETKFTGEFIEKYFKITKLHKIKRINKDIAMNMAVNITIFKNIEAAVNTVKQFSNIFRSIDSYSLTTVINLVTKNILYYIINAEVQIRERLANLSTNKQMTLNSVILSMNMANNVKAPYISPLESDENLFTLVLDLDETLVHFFYTPSGGSFLIRPGAHEFLEEMSQNYEIIIFTAAMKDYADNILDKLDKNKNLIKHRLYRQHTTITNIGVIKDLSKLGRNLAKMIIIDNIAENFKMQPNNGLFIKTWNDDMKDNQLNDLAKILKEIKVHNVPDVRNVIKKIKDEVSKKVKKNCSNPYANIDISKLI